MKIDECCGTSGAFNEYILTICGDQRISIELHQSTDVCYGIFEIHLPDFIAQQLKDKSEEYNKSTSKFGETDYNEDIIRGYSVSHIIEDIYIQKNTLIGKFRTYAGNILKAYALDGMYLYPRLRILINGFPYHTTEDWSLSNMKKELDIIEILSIDVDTKIHDGELIYVDNVDISTWGAKYEKIQKINMKKEKEQCGCGCGCDEKAHIIDLVNELNNLKPIKEADLDEIDGGLKFRMKYVGDNTKGLVIYGEDEIIAHLKREIEMLKNDNTSHTGNVAFGESNQTGTPTFLNSFIELWNEDEDDNWFEKEVDKLMAEEKTKNQKCQCVECQCEEDDECDDDCDCGSEGKLLGEYEEVSLSVEDMLAILMNDHTHIMDRLLKIEKQIKKLKKKM